MTRAMRTLVVIVMISWMTLVSGQDMDTQILGLRLSKVTTDQSYTEEGVITVKTGMDVEVEVIGVNIDEETVIKLTTAVMDVGDDCDKNTGDSGHLQTKHFTLESQKPDNDSGGREGRASFEVVGQNKVILLINSTDIIFSSKEDTYRVCVKDKLTDTFVYQGDYPELRLHFYSPLLPIWLMAVLVSILLCLSGLFSGLNLGLMALDQTELQIVIKTGTEQEQEDAKAISPVRAMGNFLLCSLLLGNVLVNNTLTIMLDALTGGGGLIAVIGSTMGIVVFGEIIPQALCSRHGLAVGARTIFITKFFMLVTSPLSWPISKILDCILGEELGTVYNRERLLELLRVQQDQADLNKDEVNILSGALQLQEKTVEDIMTPLGDCYMLPLNSVLDFETISEIKDKGYSRIPVYDGEESKIVYILLAKDLLFVDPDDKKPLEEVCKFYKTPFLYIDKSTQLHSMLEKFRKGDIGHLAMVKDFEEETAIGLVTLEDIIEEIIQAEIVDETDIVSDNRSRKKLRKLKGKSMKEKEFQMFVGEMSNTMEVSPQVVHAVLQFLSTSLPPFSEQNIRTDILKKLLNLDVFKEFKFVSEEEAKEQPILECGKANDTFILIIEGKVEVQIGTEGYVFESGPFTSFGKQILEQVLEGLNGNSRKLSSPTKEKSLCWIPECTLIAKTDVLYLMLQSKTFKAAVLASKASAVDIPASETVETNLDSIHSNKKENDPLL